MGVHRSIGVGLGDVRIRARARFDPDGLLTSGLDHPWRSPLRISLKLFHRLNRRFIPVIPANWPESTDPPDSGDRSIA